MISPHSRSTPTSRPTPRNAPSNNSRPWASMSRSRRWQPPDRAIFMRGAAPRPSQETLSFLQRLLGRGEGRKNARASFRWELGGEGAAMQLDQPAGDVEAEAQTRHRRIVEAGEPIEHVPALPVRDSNAAVGNADPNGPRSRLGDIGQNQPASGAVLDGV